MINNPHSKKQVLEAIHEVLAYYAVQGKALSIVEILRYIRVSVDQASCASMLEDMIRQKLVLSDLKRLFYTLPEYGINLNLVTSRKRMTFIKLQKMRVFMWLLQLAPTTLFVAVTGSCGLENASPDDDVDILVVTAGNRLFVTRLWSLLWAQLCHVRRKRGVLIDPDTICMNLWLDNSDLVVPQHKRSAYTARELAQMRVIYDIANVESRLISQNDWIYEWLPNYTRTVQSKFIDSVKKLRWGGGFVDGIENLAKTVQMKHIKAHQTIEYVTDTQLWFHLIDRSNQT